jgi:hypothetical protein
VAEAEVAKLTAERDALKGEVAGYLTTIQLQALSGRGVRFACAWCAESAATQGDGFEHTKVCPKNPLVAEVARLTSALDACDAQLRTERSMAADCRAEVARLRNALAVIAGSADSWAPGGVEDWKAGYDELRRIARAALAAAPAGSKE